MTASALRCVTGEHHQSPRKRYFKLMLAVLYVLSRRGEEEPSTSNVLAKLMGLVSGECPVTYTTLRHTLHLSLTYLQTAVNAKMAAMLREFERLREQTTAIPWCQKCWWEEESLELTDWLLVDAWYRSRCLELPNVGEAMIPCVDMVNHSSEPNSYYEQTPNNGVALVLRPDLRLDVPASEITISYGTTKTGAEMLFSYGFIDKQSSTRGLVLNLEPFPDDPLGKAKAAVFAGSPTVTLSAHDDVQWESPFLYLMCLNEEDGLEFRVLQQTDGSLSPLKVLWQGNDVTNATSEFESLIEEHPLRDVFKLRAVTLLQDRLRGQLEKLYESEDAVQALASSALVPAESQHNALLLRRSEVALLEVAFIAVDTQVGCFPGEGLLNRPAS